jgi:large conductance mechanosensitive channel
MLRDFRDCARQGNVNDFAPGVIIGAASSAIVTSLVDGAFMPMIGLLPADVDLCGCSSRCTTRTLSQSSR